MSYDKTYCMRGSCLTTECPRHPSWVPDVISHTISYADFSKECGKYRVDKEAGSTPASPT